MSVTAIPNLPSQIERAVRAWLVTCGIDAATIFTTNESADRTGLNSANGITDIYAHQSKCDPEFTGNEVFQLAIQHKFGAEIQPGVSSGIQTNRIAIDARVGLQMAAMSQSDNSQNFNVTVAGISTSGRALKTSDPTNNADMDAFTCNYMRFLGSSRGKPDDNACAWVEVRNYEITACPANVD